MVKKGGGIVAFRTVEITKPAELHVQNGQLKVQRAETDITIPLEDIHNIICIGANIRLSTLALSKLAENNITLMSLNEHYKPSGLVMPVVANSKQTDILYKQIAMKDALKARLWQSVVKSKVKNQGQTLKLLGICDKNEFTKLVKKVQLNDKTNIEAYAARIYFKALKEGFNRNDEFDPLNSALNYGYAIVRNTIIRELLSSGLQPALGLFHRNQFNAFNLADDLIEPFRPMVDMVALKNVGNDIVLSKQQRYNIACVVHNGCMINGKKVCMLTAIKMMIDSLKSVVEKRRKTLLLPEIIDIEITPLINE